MPAKSKKIRNKGLVAAAVILILLCDLIFLFYIKYENQGLELSDFSLFYIGNILNILFTVAAILGVILYSIKVKNEFNAALLISFSVILSLLLLFAYISTKISLPLPNDYLLDHPLKKIAIGFLFSLYQYFQFLFIGIVWFYLLGGKELIYLRAVVNSAALVMVLLFLAFIYINLKKTNNKKISPVKNATNVAIVLGAAVWSHNSPSPSLAARADKAVELLKNGEVNKIQLTGSNAPGELSEAEVAFNYIKSENVDTSKIWLEDKTVSTAEQVRFIKDQILTKKKIGNVIIVSDSYHLTRVREMCRFYKIKIGMAASDLKLNFQHNLYYKMKESIGLLVFWFFAL
ncbi:MAG: YdcF family protein [Bacteroidetes bacterium]|nr:YdcF family protein [Bacteroidota bacterium]